MAGPAADTRLAPVAVTIALAVVLAVASFALMMPVLMVIDGPTPLPAPFPPQNQDAETLAFLLAYVVCLPASLVAGRWLAAAVTARAGAAALSALTALLAASLGAAVAVVKLSGALGGPDGVRTVLVAVLAWWLVAGIALAASPAWLGRFSRQAWALAALGSGAAVVALTDLDSVSATGLVVAGLAAAVAYAAYERLRRPRLSRPWAVALEVAIVVVLLLAIPDLLIFRPEDAPGNVGISVETSIIRFHQNFLLGPAGQVLGGGAMLVDTASQYGVGDIYALVAWFLVAPIGYGTFGLIDGVMTALWFAAGYGVLRIAGTTRTLAASALGVAVVALVFNLTYPVGALPQYGPLRFGMPMAVILAEVAAERWPARARRAHIVALAFIGLASVWSLEALAYTAAVFAALTCMRAWLREPPGRVRWLIGETARVALACACAHVLFAAVTLAATGRLPDWGQYLAYLHAFLGGPVGDLTYDIPRWSPGLAVGVGYLASAAALIELARRRHPLVDRERTAVIALTALTAYGIALLSYWVDRSLEHILVHVALPALLTAALWLAVLLRSRAGVPQAARRAGLALALAVAVLVVASAWSSIGDRFPRSALAHAAPGGESLRGALHRLWYPPPLNRAAVGAERMLERYMPGERRSVVIVAPDLAIETFVRSGRTDELFLADPWETSFVADERLPDLRRRLAALQVGDRMLVDQPALATLRSLRANPSADPLTSRSFGLAPLQQWALSRIDARFRLRTVASEQGFEVIELAGLRA